MSEKLALQALLRAVDERTVEVDAERPREGRFFGLLTQYDLDETDIRLVAQLLAARLDGRRSLGGEALLAGLAGGSAERLAALAALQAGSRLIASGLVLPDVVPDHGAEALAANYRLGELALRRACEVFGQPRPKRPAPPTGPYRNNAELLSDLRRLSVLFRQRAARVFQLDPWSGPGLDSTEGAQSLVAQARAEAVRISARLRGTPRETETIPLLHLRDEHGLDLDALVILTTVLYQEILDGIGTVDAVDLVRLVSENEEDMLRRRALLRPLVRKGLLRLEGAFAGKELTADASLPNEVVDEMLGGGASIDSDSRIDFHDYLEKLESSDPFFLDMDGGPADD